ncbi:MAG: protein kinase [Acidobacteriota bacterium]
MTPQQWRKLQDSFEEVLRSPRAERQFALETAEAALEDESLRQELRRLVEHAEPQADFLRPLEGIREAMEQGRSLEPGDVLADRFEIVRFIGRGGMGAVFEAFDRKLQEPVAIKTIAPEFAHDPILLERFQREVQLARRITHPNVCRIHDFGEHNGTPYLTMELLDGVTLPESLERGALEIEDWERMALQLFEGLRAAHEVGIFHRDLKPSNLMLVGPKLVILDFGLARPVESNRSNDFSRPGMILGTPDWMAPEQLLGEGNHKSDLYSAALVLVHAITGTPAANHRHGIAGVVSRVVGVTDIAEQLPASVSPAWRRALLSCLELDPKLRPASTDDVLKLIDEYQPPPAKPKSPWSWWDWRIAFGILFFALALLIVVPRYLVRPELKSDSTILMVPTMNVTGARIFDAIGTVMNTSVAQSARFNVWQPERLPGVLRSMREDSSAKPTTSEWREVAFRERAGMICFSTLSPIGSGFSLAVECEQTGSTPTSPLSKSHREFRATDTNGVYGLVHEAGAWIRSEAGEGATEVSANNRAPQDITSPSWEALDLFEQARSLSQSQRFTDAIPLLERALQKDPQFAMGLMTMADLANGLGESEKGFAYWRKAIEAAKEQRLSNREGLSIESRYALEIRDYATAEPMLREWVRSFPNDRQAVQYLGACLLSTGRYEEGTELAHAAQERFGPSTFGTSLLIRGLGALNRPAEMDEQSKLLEKIGAKTLALRFRGMAAAMRGDYERAESLFRELESLAEGDESSRARGLLAHLVADQGRLKEAGDLLDRAIAMDRSAGRIAFAARKLVAAAYLEGEAGRRTQAGAMAEDAAAQDPSPYVIVDAVSVLARNGYAREAERVMSKFTFERGPYFDASRLRMNGEILISRGRFQEGVAVLENAVRTLGTHRPQEFLARALDLAGQHDRAYMLYQRIAKDRWYIWGSPESVWPGTRYRAEAYPR